MQCGLYVVTACSERVFRGGAHWKSSQCDMGMCYLEVYVLRVYAALLFASCDRVSLVCIDDVHVMPEAIENEKHRCVHDVVISRCGASEGNKSRNKTDDFSCKRPSFTRRNPGCCYIRGRRFSGRTPMQVPVGHAHSSHCRVLHARTMIRTKAFILGFIAVHYNQDIIKCQKGKCQRPSSTTMVLDPRFSMRFIDSDVHHVELSQACAQCMSCRLLFFFFQA